MHEKATRPLAASHTYALDGKVVDVVGFSAKPPIWAESKLPLPTHVKARVGVTLVGIVPHTPTKPRQKVPRLFAVA